MHILIDHFTAANICQHNTPLKIMKVDGAHSEKKIDFMEYRMEDMVCTVDTLKVFNGQSVGYLLLEGFLNHNGANH